MPTLPTPGGDVDTWGDELNEWLAKGGEVFNVKDGYAAVGDGTADDSTEIQNAINAADTAGGGVVYFPEGTYRCSSGLTGKRKVKLVGAGPEISIIKFDDTFANGIDFSGITSFATSTAITANANAGQRILAVTSTASFAAGDEVYISDTYQLSTDAVFQEVFHTRIKSIDNSTQMTLVDELPVTYFSAETATVAKPTSGYVLGVGIHDLTLLSADSPGRTTVLDVLVKISIANGLRFSNVVFDGGRYGIFLNQCKDTKFVNCRFENILDFDGAGSTTAQAILLERCNDADIIGCSSYRAASGPTITWGCLNVNIIGGNWRGASKQSGFPLTADTDNGGRAFKVIGSSRASIVGATFADFGYDGGHLIDAAFVTIESCTFEHISDAGAGSGKGVVIGAGTGGDAGGRCRDVVVANCHFSDIAQLAVHVSGAVAGARIIGNTFRDTDLEATLSAVRVETESGGVLVMGNWFKNYGASRPGLWCLNGENVIIGNRFENGASGWAIYTVDGPGDNRIIGNHYDGESTNLDATDRLGVTTPPSPSAYTVTNATVDRAYNANSYSMDELADVLGTLIADLQSRGLIG